MGGDPDPELDPESLMNVAVLAADVANPSPNVGDYFITESLRRSLKAHQVIEVPLHRSPDAKTIETLRSQDVLLVGGTNIIGISGTVRSSFSAEDFRRIGRPAVPVGIGAQAKLNGRIRIDRHGRELLRLWKETCGTISVRDLLTQQCLDGVLGAGSSTLTGCSSLLLRGTPFPPGEPIALFCPGPYWPPVPLPVLKSYHALTVELQNRISAAGRSLCLIQQADGLRFRFPPSALLLFAPSNPRVHLDAVCSGTSILSFRIHPLLVGAANGIPGMLVALDERTKSLAETTGVPFVVFDSALTAESVMRKFQDTLDRYPWRRIRERVAELRQSLCEYLARFGLHPLIDEAVRSPASSDLGAFLAPPGRFVNSRASLARIAAGAILRGAPLALRLLYYAQRLGLHGSGTLPSRFAL
jgi:hypothetical protein